MLFKIEKTQKKQKSSPVANESVLRQLDCLLKSRKDKSKVKE